MYAHTASSNIAKADRASKGIDASKSPPRDPWQQIKNDLKRRGFRHCLTWLDALARVHGLPDQDQPNALPIFLQSIVNAAQQTYDGKSRIGLNVSGGAKLEPKRMALLGLLLNEAIARALKHAFQKGSDGRIACTFCQEGNQCLLTVRDDGCGFTAAVPEHGLPLMAALTEQLDGTLECHSLDRGTCVEVSFPAVLLESGRIGASE